MEGHEPSTIAARLEETVRRAHARLAAVDVEALEPHLEPLEPLEPLEQRARGWSPKEVLGHLIDSASNNHGRFVRAQFDAALVYPGYDQDGWVACQRYAAAPWTELLQLWSTFNLHLARVVRAAPPEACERPRAEHNLDKIAFRTVPADEPATLGYFMADYVDHLEHHLEQLYSLLPAAAAAGEPVRDRKEDP